eukprot:361164-Chlamydomonas_euryale.AAC.2
MPITSSLACLPAAAATPSAASSRALSSHACASSRAVYSAACAAAATAPRSEASSRRRRRAGSALRRQQRRRRLRVLLARRELATELRCARIARVGLAGQHRVLHTGGFEAAPERAKLSLQLCDGRGRRRERRARRRQLPRQLAAPCAPLHRLKISGSSSSSSSNSGNVIDDLVIKSPVDTAAGAVAAVGTSAPVAASQRQGQQYKGSTKAAAAAAQPQYHSMSSIANVMSAAVSPNCKTRTTAVSAERRMRISLWPKQHSNHSNSNVHTHTVLHMQREHPLRSPPQLQGCHAESTHARMHVLATWHRS